ncbi:Pre-mRNA cleavage complex II protein Clp1-domain-containing protein [Neohortaea acidophila]|uniref:Polynucleotide 5'-hydroxyl-kinase GRC3 n=1 Tax=Neohortaea acidophila TaxID=245834 RepID=A0A6A6PSP2_9PEZI|nr:Pre-mRNA cleavage complex II protein Clp1-domain-containing protein [Neohortaea acidophila]KAF2482992.1 Pre-mRNA cleavage complex II protein Clp1-domain-containing protein [Neohortaea acidophila]
MSLPGLSLPGLGLSQPSSSHSALGPGTSSNSQSTRTEELGARTEWRFEVNFHQQYHVRLLSGNAEIFGVELALNQRYSFSGAKGVIFTWHGCQLELSGDAESEYAGLETEYAVEWLNVHGMLESARDLAHGTNDGGPRVLVVGPESVGKSSLVRSLAGWSVKCGRTPAIVNVDPREGLLAPPGSFTAVTVGSQLDVENGYGIAPISGPTVTPIKTPLIYHCPYSSPTERPDVYKALITRTALSVLNRMEEDKVSKESGLMIDTPGLLNDPKSNYDMIAHLVSEFSITLILTLGSERLYNDLNRRFGPKQAASAEGEGIPVLRVSKPGGAVERDAGFLKQLANQQIRQYFFGTSKEPLNPHSHICGFAELSVYRANSATLAAAASSYTKDEDEDDSPYTAPKASADDFEKMTPTNAMLGRLVAIKYCDGDSDDFTIRDSAVMGFLYVSEVDEQKKRVRFLAPHPQRWGDKALVWGGCPEAVTDLVG